MPARSSTTTLRFSQARRYAVVNPAIPAPTIHTSALISVLSTGGSGKLTSAIHTEDVLLDSLCNLNLAESTRFTQSVIGIPVGCRSIGKRAGRIEVGAIVNTDTQ